MDVRGSKICRMAIIVSMVALVGWFTAAGNALLVAISITAGVVLLYLCKSKIKEVVEDERDVKVSEKGIQAGHRDLRCDKHLDRCCLDCAQV